MCGCVGMCTDLLSCSNEKKLNKIKMKLFNAEMMKAILVVRSKAVACLSSVFHYTPFF